VAAERTKTSKRWIIGCGSVEFHQTLGITVNAMDTDGYKPTYLDKINSGFAGLEDIA
jgi:hypothetical protein